MSQNTIQTKIEQIRNETQQYGNTRGRVADLLTMLNTEKLDKTGVQRVVSDILNLAPEFLEYVKAGHFVINADAGFGGTLVVADDPAPTKPTWYFAKESGTYPNAGGLVVDLTNKLVILSYDGTTWSKSEEEMPAPITNITQINNTYELDPAQIVPSEALYTDETLAGDIIKRIDKNTGENVNYRETINWYDGTSMTDSKVDGDLYIKKGSKYYRKVIDKDGELFLEKDTMTQMRALTPREILYLKANIYKGVKLNGYYVKGDTPAPIEYFLSSTTNTDDGGSIIQIGSIKLEHKFNNIINVSYFGAKGDGLNDDTECIQNALNFGSNIYVPNGTYMIKAHNPNRPPNGSGYLIGVGGVEVKSNTVLSFDKSAVFKCISANHNAYNLIRIVNSENIVINNPTLLGDRETNTSTGGEWGYGIAIMGSKNIEINNIVANKMWGDGINLQVLTEGHAGVTELTHCYNIKISNGLCSENRRQGMSIESGIDLVFENMIFEKTNGIAPQFGVDIEPWGENNTVDNVIFTNCTFDNNANGGLLVWGDMISNVFINDCIFKGETYQHFNTGRQPKNININNCYFYNQGTRALNIRGGEIHVKNSTLDLKSQINEASDTEIFWTKKIVFKDCVLNASVGSSGNCESIEFHSCIMREMYYHEAKNMLFDKCSFFGGSGVCNTNTNPLTVIDCIFNNTTETIRAHGNTSIYNNIFINCERGIRGTTDPISNFKCIGNSFINCGSDLKIDLQDVFTNNTDIELIDNLSNNGNLYNWEAISGSALANNYGILAYSGNKVRSGGVWFVKNASSGSFPFITEGETSVDTLSNDKYTKKNGVQVIEPFLSETIATLPGNSNLSTVLNKVNEIIDKGKNAGQIG